MEVGIKKLKKKKTKKLSPHQPVLPTVMSETIRLQCRWPVIKVGVRDYNASQVLTDKNLIRDIYHLG